MANPRNPNDPYRAPDNAYRAADDDEDIRRQARLDSELQPDPELAEGSGNGGKVAMFTIAIALVLGVIFYGLNNSSSNQAGMAPTSSTAQNTPQTSPPTAPPGMRDVTPRANTEPGTTTGAAPTRPSPPPEMNRSANPPAASPPAGNAPPSK